MVLRVIILIFLTNIAFGTELKTITPESFLAENPSIERKAIVNFLVHQFDSKRTIGVTQAKLDQLWANKKLRNTYMMARFQIVNQQVYAESYYLGHYYFPILLQYFQKLVQNYKINDVDFIIYLREEIPMNENLGKETLGIPAFMMFQDLESSYETDKLLFPDAFFIKENKNASWKKLIDRINHASANNPWKSKTNKVFWRGTTTGNFLYFTIDNFAKLPRLTVSVLSQLYPDLIDAGFSYYSPQILDEDHGQNLSEFCKLLFKKISRVNEEGHLKYKYLLSLDGNAATGTRVPWIMLSNSVLVKQETQKIQWFYSSLKPYVNYIPVNKDLTDIFTQLNWMKTHDEQVKQISINAQKFTQDNLMPEHIEQHIVLLLNEYSTIQKDPKIIPTLTQAEDVVSISSVIGMYLFKCKRYFTDRINTWF